MTRDKRILIKNIYYMLSYAFTALDQGEYEDIAAEEFDNLHNLFAAILAKGIGRQLKQGLYREYLDRTESLPVLRGKIDMHGTIHNCMARKRTLSCQYDELSENHLLNQILKTTALLLLRHQNVDEKYKAALKGEMLFFSGVDAVDPERIPWASLRFQRNNRAYRILIGLCRFVLEGMLLTTEEGIHRLASFLDERSMDRLYEKFILEYYARECPGVKASASQIPWALDDGLGPMLPVMQTDVTLSRGNRALIIDAKWYSRATQVRYGVHTLHSHNLYQIFTYVKNQKARAGNAAHDVSGMLLYAKTDELSQPDGVFQMSGSKISVRTLDLNQEFGRIASQLNAIAEEHFGQDAFLR